MLNLELLLQRPKFYHVVAIQSSLQVRQLYIPQETSRDKYLNQRKIAEPEYLSKMQLVPQLYTFLHTSKKATKLSGILRHPALGRGHKSH